MLCWQRFLKLFLMLRSLISPDMNILKNFTTCAVIANIISWEEKKEFIIVPIHMEIQKKINSYTDSWTDWEEENTCKKLPNEYQEIYEELLDLYDSEELESLRKEYGDQILYQIYVDEYGPFYSSTNEK